MFVNKEDNSLTIADKWDTTLFPPSKFEPIGIVVIPNYHGVLKDRTGTKNQCGVMSIVPMNCSTPTTGGTSEQGMYWGDTYSNPTGRYYKKVVKSSSNTPNVADGLSGSSYILRQDSVGGTPKKSSAPFCPSPYIGEDFKSGGYNESYGTTKFDTSSDKNALSDFDGIDNTDKILAERGLKDYGSWKPSTNDQSDYPAASCCDMFYTIGTKQGDWYLPSAGEFGYIIPRLYDINDTIGKLNTAYGVGVQLSTDGYFWTSSEYSDYNARDVYMPYGHANYYNKDGWCIVRAFMRL